jgi:hypothetical protein
LGLGYSEEEAEQNAISQGLAARLTVHAASYRYVLLCSVEVIRQDTLVNILGPSGKLNGLADGRAINITVDTEDAIVIEALGERFVALIYHAPAMNVAAATIIHSLRLGPNPPFISEIENAPIDLLKGSVVRPIDVIDLLKGSAVQADELNDLKSVAQNEVGGQALRIGEVVPTHHEVE